MEGNEEVKEHYQTLARAVSQVPKHNVLLVIGDFNGCLGKDKAMYSYHENSNNNGN